MGQASSGGWLGVGGKQVTDSCRCKCRGSGFTVNFRLSKGGGDGRQPSRSVLHPQRCGPRSGLGAEEAPPYRTGCAAR